jgi:hypothetical protein
MKKSLLSALVFIGAFLGSSANATVQTYDITVAGDAWVSVGSPIFGLSGQPTLSGWVTVDNTLTGFAAFQYFSFTTGTHTWTLSEFVGPTANALFDDSGNLAQFSLADFSFGGTSMYFHSLFTTSIYNGDDWLFCNQCISLKPGVARAIDEPEGLALLGLGILWLGIRLGREKK